MEGKGKVFDPTGTKLHLDCKITIRMVQEHRQLLVVHLNEKNENLRWQAKPSLFVFDTVLHYYKALPYCF